MYDQLCRDGSNSNWLGLTPYLPPLPGKLADLPAAWLDVRELGPDSAHAHVDGRVGDGELLYDGVQERPEGQQQGGRGAP